MKIEVIDGNFIKLVNIKYASYKKNKIEKCCFDLHTTILF